MRGVLVFCIALAALLALDALFADESGAPVLLSTSVKGAEP